MNKLRSDSAFCQLTPQQAEALEGWLFEERLGYPRVVEKLKSEFGLETSLTGVRRFYKRLEMERSRESLMDAVEMSGLTVEALKSGDLKPAMLLFANKCLFELLRQSPVPIKEVTTLLRTITSAEAHTMRQTIYEKEQADLKEAKRIREARESWRITPWDLEQEKEERRQERAARKKAKQEAAEKAAKASVNSSVAEQKAEDGRVEQVPFQEPELGNEKCHLSPALSPKGGEGEELAQQSVLGAFAAPIAPARPQPSDPLAPRGTSGERAGERGVCVSTDPLQAGGPVPSKAGGAWQPSVVEEREYAENDMAEAAENRLTPLNAA